MTNQFEKFNNIPKEKFKLANRDVAHDMKLDTKPISYFRDTWNRFKRNKASVVAFGIIIFLLLFSILAPLFTPYEVSYKDTYLRFTMPKSNISEALGWNFWDGCTDVSNVSKEQFLLDYSMGIETGNNAIKNQKYTRKLTMSDTGDSFSEIYSYRLDTYHSTGVILKNIEMDEYAKIQEYQDETGIQVIFPITILNQRPAAEQDKNNGNYWFKTQPAPGGKTQAVLDESNNFINIYAAYTGLDSYTSKMRVEGEGVYTYNYARSTQTGVEVRVNYYNYYTFYHSVMLDDGIGEPFFFFGTTASGQDILTCLASGARFSFFLGIVVAVVNIFVGTIYGAIEGYYGGTADLIMERIADILIAIPMMIVITLLKLHMRDASHILVLFIAFFATGWIGAAGSVRREFYRNKNSEFILAARTLGACDRRIMFKHIFPNSIGPLITGWVMVIPGVIFGESQLSYLGIINLESGDITSVGTLLANAQPYLATFPHMILFPSIFISLLMLSFNLFGNGLRDAFNPSLRGSEE